MDGLEIKIFKNHYTVKYPNVGQFIDIKTQENILSKGQMQDLILSGMYMKDSEEVVMAIKTLACFSVLIPELTKDLKSVNSLRELSLEDFAELTSVYINLVNPWLTEWQNKIRELTSPKEKNV